MFYLYTCSHPGFECSIVETVDTLAYIKTGAKDPILLHIYAGTCCNMHINIHKSLSHELFHLLQKRRKSAMNGTYSHLTSTRVRKEFILHRSIFRVTSIRQVIAECFALSEKPVCQGWLRKCRVKKYPLGKQNNKNSNQREGAWQRRYRIFQAHVVLIILSKEGMPVNCAQIFRVDKASRLRRRRPSLFRRPERREAQKVPILGHWHSD